MYSRGFLQSIWKKANEFLLWPCSNISIYFICYFRETHMVLHLEILIRLGIKLTQCPGLLLSIDLFKNQINHLLCIMNKTLIDTMWLHKIFLLMIQIVPWLFFLTICIIIFWIISSSSLYSFSWRWSYWVK